jgi:hypothetical protein
MARALWLCRFTIEDLARATGMSERDVRRARRKKEFVWRDFDSVFRWAFARRLQRLAAVAI